MKLKYLIMAVLFFASLSFAQWQYFRPDLGPILIERSSDKEIIKTLVRDIEQCLYNHPERITKFLSKDFKLKNDLSVEPISDQLPLYKIENSDISVNGNEAILLCDISDNQNQKIIKEKINLKRISRYWEITGSSFLIKFILGLNKNPNVNYIPKENPKSTYISEFRTSNTALIQRTAWWTSINTINRTVTKQEIDRFLFDVPFDGKVLRTNNSDACFTVVTDYLWRRIIYGSKNGGWTKSYGDNPGDIKFSWPTSIELDKFGNIFVLADRPERIARLKYNESQGLINFEGYINLLGLTQQPVDLAMDANLTPDDITDDALWIADKLDNAICKIDWNGNLLGKYKRIINMWTGEQIPLFHPTKILTARNTDYNGNFELAIIDSDKQRVIIISVISHFQNDAIYCKFVSSRFNDDLNVSLTSLGFFSNELGTPVWVGDKKNSMFHIFGRVNQGYLGSVKAVGGINQWINPKGLFSTSMSNSNGDYIGAMTLDNWDNSHGINTYYEGTDLFDLNTTMDINPFYNSPRTQIFGTFLTQSWFEPYLFYSDGVFINQPFTNGLRGSERQEIITYNSWDLPNTIGKYKLKLIVEPRYNASYGQWQMTPITKEIFFSLPLTTGSISGPSIACSGSNITFTSLPYSGSGEFSYTWFKKLSGSNNWMSIPGNTSTITQQMGNTGLDFRCVIKDIFTGSEISILKSVELMVTPSISGFTQSPIPIYKGSSGTVTCNLSQGNGDLTYIWSLEDPKPGLSISSNGDNSATVTYSSIEILSVDKSVSIKNIEAPVTSVVCTVSNGAGSATFRKALYVANQPPPGGGCPFVYSWIGEDWMEDNNILPQSQDSTILGQDVTDFYQLYSKPRIEENKYYLAVGEFEHEKSYLDQLKLLVVDHPQETFITVTDEGQVIQFAKPANFASAELDSEDVYKLLYGLDGEKVAVEAEQEMALSFEGVSGSEEPWVLIIGQVAHATKEKLVGNILGENKESFTSFRLRRNPFYQWVQVPANDTNSLQINILWKGEAEVDYTELSRRLELPFTLYTPELINAEHNILGDVKNQLLMMDEDRTELNPNEWITLEFSAPPVNEGMERSFVFVSRGRYETLPNTTILETKKQIPPIKQKIISKVNTSANEVKEYKLSQNYPNPFNPVTTIHYSVKEPGFVTLKLYDLLGREVAGLVNENKLEGNYIINFDASSLSSGIYVCRMKVNEFSTLMKMIVLK